MDKKTQCFTLPLASGNDWIKINAGQFALVRVAHSLEMTSTYYPPTPRTWTCS